MCVCVCVCVMDARCETADIVTLLFSPVVEVCDRVNGSYGAAF